MCFRRNILLGPQTINLFKFLLFLSTYFSTRVRFQVLKWKHSQRRSKAFFCFCTQARWHSLVAQMIKNLPAVQETWVRSLGQEDPLEKGMGTSHSSILAWRIPWTEEPGRLQIMGLQRVVHDWATKYTCTLAGKSSLRSLCSKSTYPYLFLKKWLIVILSGMGSINLNNIFLKWESQSP